MPWRIQLYWSLFLISVSGMWPAPAVYAELMPGYRLGVGSALIFEVRKEHLVGDRVIARTGTNTVFIVGQKPNGNWLGVLTGTLTARDATGSVLKSSEDLNIFEMTARGKILESDDPVDSETHRDCFVALPEETGAVRSSWEVAWPGRGEIQRYTMHAASDPEQGKWIWTRVDGGMQKELHGITRTATALFNAQAGLLERMESRSAMMVDGTLVRGATIVQLRRSDILLDFELKKLIAQSALFKELRSDYFDSLGAAVSSELEPDAQLKNAAQRLSDAVPDFSYPIVERALQRERALHEQHSDIILAEATFWRPKLGQAPQLWRTETLAGEPVLSASLKDTITILHLWQADSVASVRGLRKLDALAKRLEGKPVKILSANVDREIEKAITAAAQAKVQHPVIKGGPLLKHYPARVLPSLFVFDTKGVLRDVRFGTHAYRPGPLESMIERLLTE